MKIGLICAIQEESEHILQEMVITEKVIRLKTTFYQGQYMGQDIVFVIGGIGKVSSALCTQVLIDQFAVEIVIFSGIAGALHSELMVGDTVIGIEAFYHDVDLAGEGIKTNTITSIFRNRFRTDPDLIAMLQKTLVSKRSPLPSVLEKRRQGKDLTITFGRILTGDQVITSRTKVQELCDQFQGDCVEMEGAAVAQTCVLNEVPFLIIRTISDLADEDAMQTAMESMDSVVKINYHILQDVLANLKTIYL